MITTKLRQLIIQKSFTAIKSLYGIQEKLKLEGYHRVLYNDRNELLTGIFYLKSSMGNYYRIEMADYDKITSLKRGKVKVTF